MISEMHDMLRNQAHSGLKVPRSARRSTAKSFLLDNRCPDF